MTTGRQVIMLLSNPFEPDVRVLKEARSLVAAGYAVTILCWDRPGKFPAEQSDGQIRICRIQIHSAYGGGINLLWNFVRFNAALVKRVMNEDADIVHCHDLDTLPGGFIASRLKRSALVYDEHETEYFTRLPSLLRRIFRAMERFLARRADLVLVTNLIQVRKIQSMLKAGKVPVEVKNCPLKAFFHAPALEERGKVTVGWIGYLQRGTGIDRLVRICDRLAEGHPELQLLLVGKIHPDYVVELQAQLQSARHPERIELVAAVPYDQVFPFYRRVDIAALLYEDMIQYRLNTPTKLFEAMAQGIPVVATAIGDVQEIVEAHHCGYIVAAGNEDEMERKLEALIMDRALRLQMGKNGFQAAERYYNWELMASRLVKHYCEIA